MKAAWHACNTNSLDFKELIPELFYAPDVFGNTNNFPLGHLQDGTPVANVVLPPWAKGDPHEFVRLHRMALESEYVSSHLHEWIDLIFGYKQFGRHAEEANNVFHYLTYEKHAPDLETIENKCD